MAAYGQFAVAANTGSTLVLLAFSARGPIAVYSAGVVSSLRSDKLASILFLGGAGTFLVAYVGGTNFDYRMIFLLIPIAALARTGQLESMTFAAALVLVMALPSVALLSATTANTSIGGLLLLQQMAGFMQDLVLLVLAPALGVIAFRLTNSRSDKFGPSTAF